LIFYEGKSMRFITFFVAATLTLSICDATAQTLPEPAVITALEAGNAKALIDALRGKSVKLTPEQNLTANQILLTHLAALPQDDAVGRQATADLLAALLQAQVDGNSDATFEATAPAKDLPPEFLTALAENDGAMLVRLIREDGFSAGSVGARKTELIKVVSDFAKPIPASNAKANKEAYQALAILDPDTHAYKQKAEGYAKAERDGKSAALKKLKKRVDEFSGVTFYTHPAEPRFADTRSYLLSYLAEKNGSSALRVQLHYTADSWLFISSAKFNIDGKVVPFSVPEASWKRDNDSEIWEWVDVNVTPELRSLLEQVANSKTTIIRFDGRQYYDDFTVTAKDKAAIRDVFAAEEYLKEEN
jgi:hypothetical protein